MAGPDLLLSLKSWALGGTVFLDVPQMSLRIGEAMWALMTTAPPMVTHSKTMGGVARDVVFPISCPGRRAGLTYSVV